MTRRAFWQVAALGLFLICFVAWKVYLWHKLGTWSLLVR